MHRPVFRNRINTFVRKLVAFLYLWGELVATEGTRVINTRVLRKAVRAQLVATTETDFSIHLLTADNTYSDVLLTDLLPAGFEIEQDAFVSTPLLSSVAVYDDEGDIKPGYEANMDDRYIAHFNKRWRVNKNALLKYVVRSAYTGEVQVGGAHVEHMYAPEINGRSGSFRALILEK